MYLLGPSLAAALLTVFLSILRRETVLRRSTDLVVAQVQVIVGQRAAITFAVYEEENYQVLKGPESRWMNFPRG
jgi:hypothetical protein